MKLPNPLLLIIAGIALITLNLLNTFPAQQEIEIEVEPEQPKPSHHIIYLLLCGRIEGVILTTDPPSYVSAQFPASTQQLALMAEAHEAGRVTSIDMVRRECSTPEWERT